MEKETRRNYIKVIMGERLYLHNHGMHFILFSKFSNAVLLFLQWKKNVLG